MSAQQPRQPVPGAPVSSQLAKVPQANIQRSTFDLSHGHKTNIDAGFLYPLADFEVLPGDTFRLGVSGVVQMLALKQQLMDALHLDLHWWFVPNRLVMDEWVLLNGERPDPDTPIDVLVPIVESGTGFVADSYADFMGWPLGIAQANMTESPIALPLRALVLTYNTWYRDQNLIDSVPLNTGSTNDTMADFPLLRRGKRKDPFTSMLPWAQKGDPVSVPLGTTAPVVSDGTSPTFVSLGGGGMSGNLYAPTALGVSNGLNLLAVGGGVLGANHNVAFDSSGLEVDLSAATAITINALRLAFATQQVLELFARGGTRYPEVIQSLFGVTNPDARLQRPEFLGGASVPINIHSVVNQTATASGPAMGVRTAFGHAQFMDQAQVMHSFTEHGWVLLVASVRQEYTYWQGLDRRFTRRSLYQYYMPPFAMLGEQDVRRWELFMDGTAGDDNLLGYQERWVDYRWQKSKVTSLMRPSASGTLASFHLAQQFDNTLELGQDFIEENPPLARVVAVTDEPVFNVDLFVQNIAARALPVSSVPGLRSM